MMNTWKFIAGTAICVILIGLELTAWIPVTGLIFVLWKVAIEYWQLAKPSRWLTNTLTLLSLAFVLIQYRSLMSQEGSSGFLVLLTSLKLLEERSLRDQMFLFLLGFVLIASLLLFSLELPFLIGGLISFYFFWTAQNRHILYPGTFIKVLPATLLLFLLFPRVQNPFGFQGLNVSNTGQTGFSEELNPGSISQIQNTRDLAFRVQFLDLQKRVRILDQYWRGQVLTHSQGLRWTRSAQTQRELRFEKIPQPDYEVTLEPHQQRWLFVFDPTNQLQSSEFGFYLKNNSYFEAVAPVRQRSIYRGKIAPSLYERAAKDEDLQTPPTSAELLVFVESLKSQSTSRQDFVFRLLNHYRKQKFLYSKAPGSGSSTLDDFFFKNKKGYCEHYAAATATILRLAGIPAQVVTGYQGGVFNSYGNFWKFTQADAHAWAEFQNDQGQWERVDPTTVVAPERLELGGLLFEELPEEWIGQNRTSEFLKSREAWWLQAKDFITLSFESLNYELVIFLLDFNIEKQKELLKEYGAWLLVFIGLLLSPFVVQSYRQRRKPNLGEWLLKELDHKANRQKIYRRPSETLRQFTQRWSEHKPNYRQSLQEIVAAYENLEYRPGHPPPDRETLKKLLLEIQD